MSRMVTMSNKEGEDRVALLNILFELQRSNELHERMLESIQLIGRDIEMLRSELVGARR